MYNKLHYPAQNTKHVVLNKVFKSDILILGGLTKVEAEYDTIGEDAIGSIVTNSANNISWGNW